MFHCEFEKKKLKQIDTRSMWQLCILCGNLHSVVHVLCNVRMCVSTYLCMLKIEGYRWTG